MSLFARNPQNKPFFPIANSLNTNFNNYGAFDMNQVNNQLNMKKDETQNLLSASANQNSSTTNTTINTNANNNNTGNNMNVNVIQQAQNLAAAAAAINANGNGFPW